MELDLLSGKKKRAKKYSKKAMNDQIASLIRSYQKPGSAKNKRLKLLNDRRLRWRQPHRAQLDAMRRQLAGLPGSPDDPVNWYQRVQPPWTPDALWVRIATIRAVLVHEAHEPPLTRFLPVESSRPASLGPPRTASAQRPTEGLPGRRL